MIHTAVRKSLWLSLSAASLMFALAATPAPASDTDQIVATVGSHKITEKDLEAKAGPQLSAEEAKIYEIKSAAIEKIADDYLLDQAAKKANLSVDEYITKEGGSQAKVSEADAKQFYDSHKNSLPPQPFEKIKAPLMQVLQNHQNGERREAVLAKLRAAQPVTIALKPPRMKVDVGEAPALGPANAPITIVEFGDFQCPYCKAAEESLKTIREHYGDKLRIVYLDFPLQQIHNNAFNAAQAARCAGDQGKFWPYHDQLFGDQQKLAPADLKALAQKTSLDMTKFNQCVDSGKYAAAIRHNISEGDSLGVSGTPAFFINGRPLMGAVPPQQFESIINDELKRVGQKETASADSKG